MTKTTPAAAEAAVRDAARALHAAIEDATAAGLRVVWPARLAQLDAIAISETARAAPPEPPTPPEKPARPAKAAKADEPKG